MRDGFTQLPWFVGPGFGEVPVGAVIAYAGALGPSGSSLPDTPSAAAVAKVEPWGWMACDGRELITALYPELFLILGYVYGGSDDTFNVPDYRGYFLRAMGGDETINPDQNKRRPAPHGEQSGIGSTQHSAIWRHTHDVRMLTPASAEPGPESMLTSVTGTPTGPPLDSDGGDPGVFVSSKETRPVNIYVNYIIKFTSGLRGNWGAFPNKEIRK